MADSGAAMETCFDLIFEIDELNSFVKRLVGRKSQADVVPSSPADHTSAGKRESSYLKNCRSTYLNLPQSLKSCLNYLCFLNFNPFGRWVDKSTLVRLLKAIGLINQDSSGFSVLEDLTSLGILMPYQHPIFQSVRVAYPYTQFCIEDVDRKEFVAEAMDSPIHLCIKGGGRGNLPSNLNTLSHITSLFIYPAETRNGNIGKHEKALSRADLGVICGLKSLVVLVLVSQIEFLPEKIGDLVHLKFLSLLDSRLKNLPRTIGNLQKLETLLINPCNLKELPIEVWKLERLKHLEMRIKDYNAKIRVPAGKIETMLDLHTLCGIHVGDGIATELSKLTQLRKLGISRVSDEHADELSTAIMKMTNLICLSLESERIYYEEDKLGIEPVPELEEFSPPPLLQEVNLRGQLVELPTWLLSMESLTKLCLSFSYLENDTISSLQVIPNLKYLSLIDANKANHIDKEFCNAGGFPKLETLYIRSRFLVEWNEIVNGAFPCLRSLILSNCDKLMSFPDGLQNISTLESLRVYPTFQDLKRRLQGDENYKIKNIPKVFLSSE